MSRRQNLEHHRHSLTEVQNIMNSMKTMAYIESRKLSACIDAQQAVIHSIEQASRDLLNFYPDILPQPGRNPSVILLIGSERGFCGDFNHALFRELEVQTSKSSLLISVGHKLNLLLEDDPRLTAAIDGISVNEEITSVIEQLVARLALLQEQHGLLSVSCLYHAGDDGIRTQKLLPPFHDLLHQTVGFSHPPLHNQPPEDLLLELSDHYLFAVLHQILFISLLEENHRRITHLDGAVKYLDKQLAELTRKSSALRQEEIIEEIEVILLSAASLDANLDTQT
ncbi:F0F1 ATP synthase subunit gamma [Methylophaga sp. OBS4]|uniref:F0F1 ATP synthase subunit gamma n=1 Tax=Methylophaga sp. OBS4 TaxID=2991935 RepID=UPI00224F6831|nr:F0F1 ATP synthase subunit gamma [Methylophaga sp. OBS4]MCX4186472.1 F0F1 ATP synthase subunit gamma [Methylophaga sp. OBS4]